MTSAPAVDSRLHRPDQRNTLAGDSTPKVVVARRSLLKMGRAGRRLAAGQRGGDEPVGRVHEDVHPAEPFDHGPGGPIADMADVEQWLHDLGMR